MKTTDQILFHRACCNNCIQLSYRKSTTEDYGEHGYGTYAIDQSLCELHCEDVEPNEWCRHWKLNKEKAEYRLIDKMMIRTNHEARMINANYIPD